MYEFLDKYRHTSLLADRFKTYFKNSDLFIQFCPLWAYDFKQVCAIFNLQIY